MASAPTTTDFEQRLIARLVRRRTERIERATPKTLLDYTQRLHPSYEIGRHHKILAEALEDIAVGKKDRLMVFMPPRHGKSELVSVRFPAWYLGKNPSHRVILSSYAARLAERFGGLARNQLEDARYPYGSRVAQDTSAKGAWDIEGDRGGLIAAGVGGPITGFGGDLLIIDDPVKNREEAESSTYRDKVWEWYTSTAYTRLEGRGAIVLVMTRWHEDDLAGRLLAEADQGGDQWDVVSLPALNEQGEALWPERYGVERLARIRQAIGSYDWEALYQQRPSPLEGGVFKRSWFEVVDESPEGLTWSRYWDLAASTKESADYTASIAAARSADGYIYLRDMIRGRWEWPDARRIMVQTMLSEPETRQVVEEALHGLAALQELRRDENIGGRIVLRGQRVDRDKLTRALAWAAHAEGGRVRLVRGGWIGAFLDEITTFPNGAHDDQVDAASGAIAATSARREPRLAWVN